jgi:hypothetical protein
LTRNLTVKQINKISCLTNHSLKNPAKQPLIKIDEVVKRYVSRTVGRAITHISGRTKRRPFEWGSSLLIAYVLQEVLNIEIAGYQ